jgi:hypothetical protein
MSPSVTSAYSAAVLGTGSRLVGDHGVGALQRVDSVMTTTGVLIATYRPVGAELGSR